MTDDKVDHYGATYEGFSAAVYADIRAQAFGVDIGQTGWLTAVEHDLLMEELGLDSKGHLLDIACGSGGPTLRAASAIGCRVCGIDIHNDAVRAARIQAEKLGVDSSSAFQQADASQPLPFPDETFDAIICVDAINHLPDRYQILREWARVLRPNGRVLFTDPIVITGALTSEEIAVRSSIGFFLFTLPGINEEALKDAGFQLTGTEDRTENTARIAGKWREAREARADELRPIEGDDTFDGQQHFFEVAARLAAERRLSRFSFSARRI